jgi:hypothetical protein
MYAKRSSLQFASGHKILISRAIWPIGFAARRRLRQKRVLNCKLIAAAPLKVIWHAAPPPQLMNTIQYIRIAQKVNLNKLEQLRNMQSGIIIMSLWWKIYCGGGGCSRQKARAERVICGAKSGIPDEPLWFNWVHAGHC